MIDTQLNGDTHPIEWAHYQLNGRERGAATFAEWIHMTADMLGVPGGSLVERADSLERESERVCHRCGVGFSPAQLVKVDRLPFCADCVTASGF